jgi:hypothetical protein
MPIRAYYNAGVSSFLNDDAERILGVLTAEHHHSLEEQQRWAWLQQISILKPALSPRPGGQVFLEFYIPRMGKRADVVLVTGNIVFVIEFKAGASGHASSALAQVEDYAPRSKALSRRQPYGADRPGAGVNERGITAIP